MNQWLAMYRKEMLEMSRNAKWIWVPLVFVVIGIMQPVTAYYTPQIIESMGGLPEGAVIELPMPSAPEVVVKTLSQFGTIGMLILVLASMATISGERQSGVAGMILLRPVSHMAYVTAKWAGAQTLALVSFGCGFAASAYYTAELFGSLEIWRLAQGFALYALWLSFVVTVTVAAGTWLKGAGGIAFTAIAVAALLALGGGLFAKYMAWSPSMLADHSAILMLPEQAPEQARLWLCVVSTLLLTVLLLAVGVRLFKSRSDLAI